MADQRFKPGDRVVDPNGEPAVIRALLADGWVAVEGSGISWSPGFWTLAEPHPWASELRKFALLPLSMLGENDMHERHPFRVVEGTIRAITTEGERGPGDDVDWACNEIEEGYTPTEALC